MQKQSYLDYKPVQLSLPVRTEHLIDKHDPVVSFLEVVGGLNLKKFIKTSRKGRQQYDPEMILRIILFGYMQKKFSLRELEEACKVDIRFMYLADNQTPSFMVFQRFIQDKLTKNLPDIFYEINEFLIQKEKIDTTRLYVDGTKIEANANKFSFVWKKAVLNYQAQLFIKITKELNQVNKLLNRTFEIKEQYDSLDLSEPIVALLSTIDRIGIQFVEGKGSRKTSYQRLYEKLVEFQLKCREYEVKLSICGTRNSYSKVDHDATFMHGKEDYYNKTGIFKAYYNIQIGVSDEYILHYGVYPNPTDTKTFIPLMNSYYERYQEYPKIPVADAGYGSYDNYLYCVSHQMTLMMKYNMYKKEKEKQFLKNEFKIKNMSHEHKRLISTSGEIYHYSHDYTSHQGVYPQIKEVYLHQPTEHSPSTCPKRITRDIVLLELQEEAKKNLESEEGIDCRVQRSIQVEGAFGDIKHNCEYTRFHRRGKKNIETEFLLISIGYNLRKYHSKKLQKLN